MRTMPTLLIQAIMIILAAGCAAPKPNWSPKDHSRPQLTMYLAPGDEIDISFLGAPELNKRQVIRRDGKITLRLIGEVSAAGKTPSALQKELNLLYGPQLQIKETTITVVSPAPVFVSGSVLTPGRIPMEHPMTALEAIMASGGFDTRTAEVRNVVVIRHSDGRRCGFLINFKPTLEGEKSAPFYLKPLDIVYVPRTTITKVNQWVDQHINRMLPRLGLGYSTEGEVSFTR